MLKAINHFNKPKPSGRGKRGSVASNAAFLFTGLILGGALFYAGHVFWPQPVESSLSSKPSAEPTQKKVFTGALGESTIADVAEAAAKSAVNIDTTNTVLVEDRYFGFFLGPQYQRTKGLGSGFIIRSDGYILTNNHVVENADEIKVTISRAKKPLRAKLIGRDPKNDLALIKVNATNLPVCKLGDSTRLRPGDWVIAIGSPLGLQQSVTLGIVSALDRSFRDGAQNRIGPSQLIQTDTAINPGNSGGPLLNIHGEVVGVNVAMLNAQNIGFAIPISIAKTVAQQLLETGKTVYPYLGIHVYDVTPEIAEQLGIDLRTTAVVVVTVERNAPAARGGLIPGDLILALNGKPIKTSEDFAKIVQTFKPGDTVKVDLLRDGQKAETEVTVERMMQR